MILNDIIIILNGQRLNIFPWDEEQDKDFCCLHFYATLYKRLWPGQLHKEKNERAFRLEN